MMQALQLAPSRYVNDQFETLAAELRAMMLAGLRRVLSSDSTPEQSLPTLANGAARLLEDLLSQGSGAIKALQVDGTFAALFMVTTPPELNPTQRALLAGNVTPRLRARLRMRLLNLFRPKRRVPLKLAPDAAHFADVWQFQIFASFSTQAAIARELHAHLSNRVLLWPPDTHPPQLATPSFWWLVSLGCAGPTGLKQQISSLTETLCLRENWAGFWDQYLLNAARERALPLPNNLPDLPLAVSADNALSMQPDDDAPQARLGWRRDAPAYAAALMGQGI